MLDPTLPGPGDLPLYRFATLVPTDVGIVFDAEGITRAESGDPCYGCPGTPTAVWFWRP